MHMFDLDPFSDQRSLHQQNEDYPSCLDVSDIVAAQQRNAAKSRRSHGSDWNGSPHRERLVLEGQFKCCYRMDVDAFDTLVQLLSPTLELVAVKSVNRTGTKPIATVNMVRVTISWLAGGSYHTIRALCWCHKIFLLWYLIEVMNAFSAHPPITIAAPVNNLQQP